MAMQVTITEVFTEEGEYVKKLAVWMPDDDGNCLITLHTGAYYEHEIWVKAADLVSALKVLNK